MTDFVTALLTALSPGNLWGALEPMAPIIGVVVIFALGLYFLRRVVKGASKGKVRF